MLVSLTVISGHSKKGHQLSGLNRPPELLSNPVDWLDSSGVFPESVNELDSLNYITEQAMSSQASPASLSTSG